MTAPDDPYNPGPGGPPPGYGPPPPGYGPPPAYGSPPPGYAPPPPPGYGPAPRRNNDKALLSMILGIVSLMSCGLILGIPALIIGNKAKREIAGSGEDGDGMATAGIVTGWISTIVSGLGILAYAAILIFVFSQPGS